MKFNRTSIMKALGGSGSNDKSKDRRRLRKPTRGMERWVKPSCFRLDTVKVLFRLHATVSTLFPLRKHGTYRNSPVVSKVFGLHGKFLRQYLEESSSCINVLLEYTSTLVNSARLHTCQLFHYVEIEALFDRVTLLLCHLAHSRTANCATCPFSLSYISLYIAGAEDT